MSDIEITETCRCGASTVVKGLTKDATLTAVTSWRQQHQCIGAAQEGRNDPHRTGASSAVIGFTTTRNTPHWGNGTHWIDATETNPEIGYPILRPAEARPADDGKRWGRM